MRKNSLFIKISLAAALVALLAGAGCRTFDYTKTDMERERRLLAEGLANAQSYGFGAGSCAVGAGLRPGVPGSYCPNLGPGFWAGR